MPPVRKKKKPFIEWSGLMTNCLYGVLAFAGVSLSRGLWLANDLATKPWVYERIAEQKQYIDERDKQSLKDAFEHSDANRQTMMLKMEQFNSEVKANQTAITVKVELILDALREIRTDQAGSKRSRN